MGANVACSSCEENVLAILGFSRHDVQEGEGGELESVVQTWKAKIGMTIKIDALISLKSKVATRRPLFHKFRFRLDQSRHAHFARSIAEIKGVHVPNIHISVTAKEKRTISSDLKIRPDKTEIISTCKTHPRLSASVCFVPES